MVNSEHTTYLQWIGGWFIVVLFTFFRTYWYSRIVYITQSSSYIPLTQNISRWYSVANVYINMENIANQLFPWPFSIANYKIIRGYIWKTPRSQIRRCSIYPHSNECVTVAILLVISHWYIPQPLYPHHILPCNTPRRW